MSVLLCCQALSLSLFAQQQKVDTAHIYSIPEIMVSDPYQTREVRSASPLQVFNKEELKNLQALQVSDAVKHFAGVTVKDYGGIGCGKTFRRSYREGLWRYRRIKNRLHPKSRGTAHRCFL